jgi:hypothetical protein
MFWVPLVFACLITGQCALIPFPSYTSQVQCEKAAEQIARQLESNPNVVEYEMTCLPVKAPEV